MKPSPTLLLYYSETTNPNLLGITYREKRLQKIMVTGKVG
jgi:hypothetical protein